jgi:hypothetical protein
MASPRRIWAGAVLGWFAGALMPVSEGPSQRDARRFFCLSRVDLPAAAQSRFQRGKTSGEKMDLHNRRMMLVCWSCQYEAFRNELQQIEHADHGDEVQWKNETEQPWTGVLKSRDEENEMKSWKDKSNAEESRLHLQLRLNNRTEKFPQRQEPKKMHNVENAICWAVCPATPGTASSTAIRMYAFIRSLRLSASNYFCTPGKSYREGILSARLTIFSGRLAASVVRAEPLFVSNLSMTENNSAVRIGLET